MKLKLASQLFSFRDLRNAVLGLVVVIGGLGLSGLTLYAHQAGDIRLAGISAAASLAFVLLILVFVVPPLARNAGREASQMNLPFEFTSGGAVILVLILIVGFSAWNTGNNLLFLILSFLSASLVVGFFAGSICLRKLDVSMRFPETIFAGEKTTIMVNIRNRKLIFPAFSVVVEVRGKERERSVAADDLEAILPKWIAKRLSAAPVVRRTLSYFVHVGARKTVEAQSEHTFPNRGRLSIKDFELSTKFPFGFFRHRRRLPAREAELIVFPEVTELDIDTARIPLNIGQRSLNLRGSGHDLLSLRDYRPQDDLRHIDWKATAKTRQLTVREYAADDENLVTVIFDPRVLNEKSEPIREKIALEQSGKPVVASKKFDAGASITASLLSKFAGEGSQTRLITFDFSGEFGSGWPHLYESLKVLALAEPLFEQNELPAELRSQIERILNDSDDHRFLVTANGDCDLSPDVLNKLKIIGF